jgi:rhodanese-related sulfurtransferase
MTITKMKILAILLVLSLATLIVLPKLFAQEIPRITKEEAKGKLDNPDVVFLDVRAGSDWRASDMKIKGAVHEEPGNLEEWVAKYDPEKTFVLYCA